MILLSLTITWSVALIPILYLLGFITFCIVFFAINTLFFDRYDNMTKYKDYGMGYTNNRFYYIMLNLGFIVVPLFKQIVKDARYFLAMIYESENRVLPVSYSELSNKLKYERAAKLMKLKYNKKSFVKRKVFSIFVGQ